MTIEQTSMEKPETQTSQLKKDLPRRIPERTGEAGSFRKHRLNTIGRVILIWFGVGLIFSVIATAFIWAENTHHFQLKRVKVSGLNYLEEKEILEIINLSKQAFLNGIPLKKITRKLESHPFIKGVRLSREFPSTLNIDVIERVPIAYINHSPLYLIDQDAIVLPVKEGTFEFDVPVLSGFDPENELYPVGSKCLSQSATKAVRLLGEIRDKFPTLFQDLSELRLNVQHEYELFLSAYPTKIYLGHENQTGQLHILERFAKTIQETKTLYSYEYIDLRYKNQIVAKERHESIRS